MIGGFGGAAARASQYGERYAVAAHVKRGSEVRYGSPARERRLSSGSGHSPSRRRSKHRGSLETGMQPPSPSRGGMHPPSPSRGGAGRRGHKIMYDVQFLEDGRHFYVSRVDQEESWTLPPGGIPVYPSCTVKVLVLRCMDLDDGGFRSEMQSTVEVFDQIVAYTGKDSGEETTGSTKVCETKAERGVNPNFNFESEFSAVWDEGNLIFKAKTVGGYFTSERFIGRAELSKDDMAPGGSYKVRLVLQASSEGEKKATGYVEVMVLVGTPSNSFRPKSEAPEGGPKLDEQEEDEDDAWQVKSVVNIFRQFDADGDGTIDRTEFEKVMSALCSDWDQKMLNELFVHADTDENGSVEYSEFVEFLFYGAGIGRDGDPEALKYIPEEDELVFVPDWLPSARLLIQGPGEVESVFSFVTDSSQRYSQGVQGRCTITDDSAKLEATLLGSGVQPFVLSSGTYEVILGAEPDSDSTAGCRTCSLAPSVKDGFLMPPSVPETSMPTSIGKPTLSAKKSFRRTGTWKPENPVIMRLDLSGFTAERLVALFEEIDKDGSGLLDLQEFRAFVRKHIPDCSEYDIESLAAFADKDGNGEISYDELIEFLQVNASQPSGEPTAGQYEAADGEMVFAGKYNPYGRLLVRDAGTFSYVTSVRHKYSEGVQGKARIETEQCALEAVFFGNQAVNTGRPLQTLTLQSVPFRPLDKRYAGCLTAVHPQGFLEAWGWLRPPPEETVM